MKYKKVYIEITNICNLNCSFCAKHERKQIFMSNESFELILKKLKNYTKYLYFHVMGEPLLHPEINTFIKLARSYGYFVNITTNGTLVDKIKDIKGIRQINFSLHSFDGSGTLEAYLDPIFKISNQMAEEGTYINYRLWANTTYSEEILRMLEEEYSVCISSYDKTKTLGKNIFYSKEEEFIWPNKNRVGELYPTGYCPALKDHIALLVDGTIVPCCLDNNASMPLGNIFKDDLDTIIKGSNYQNMLQNFQNNKKIHPICKNCNFYSHKL